MRAPVPCSRSSPLLSLPARGPAQAKVKVGVLKLTLLGARLRRRREGLLQGRTGIEPELVFFQAAAPIATALAAGQLDVGATGLTAALYNIVLGGEQLWIVADKGREWPGYPLIAHRRAEGPLGRRAPRRSRISRASASG